MHMWFYCVGENGTVNFPLQPQHASMTIFIIRFGKLIMDKKAAKNTVVNEEKEDRTCAT